MKILLIGDYMMDRYHFGHMERISPEAPVPIFVEDKSMDVNGGVGRVYDQLKLFGWDIDVIYSAPPVHRKWSDDVGLAIIAKGTVKERFYVGQRQVFRIDKDTDFRMRDSDLGKIEDFLSDKDYDYVVASDYGKGMIFDGIIELFEDDKVILDAKDEPYSDLFIFKCNEKEFESIFGYEAYEDTVERVRKFNHIEHFIVTRGKNNTVYASSKCSPMEIQVIPEEVADVVGAGDYFMAGLVDRLARGHSVPEAIVQANLLASSSTKRIIDKAVTQTIFEMLIKEKSTI